MFARLARYVVFALVALPASARAAEPERPNILWLTTEDISPDLGCYGVDYAHTPTLDRLAAEGVRYTRCFTHIGVCAPSRSGLVTGMYPPSIGSQHMRSTTILPDYLKTYPQLLRQAGYYTTNNSKTDYNFAVPKNAWDESSPKAHWKNRPEGKPFFAIFNLTITHESQIRAPEKAYQKNTARLKPDEFHDPAKAPLPPYFPDTPLVRHDVAQYHDNITAHDYLIADLLKELDDAGLADDTIVFYYSDHGAGLPRGKRWLYDSSLQVPLIVRYPQKWQTAATKPGTVNDELVAFVDLGPTALSLAGANIPDYMQGQAFLGPKKAATPREYVYGCRDRMDERVDMIRCVRDKQYKYIRNYQWWKPYAQNINYMNEMPTMQEWRRLDAEGKLNPTQALFMAPQKPREELYDCDADPHEVNNLAADPKYAEVLTRLRAAHEKWTEDIHDLGYLPEYVMHEFEKEGKNWRDDSQVWPVAKALREMQVTAERNGSTAARPESAMDAELRSQALYVRYIELLANDADWRSATLQSKLDSPPSTLPLFMRLGASAALIRAENESTDDATKQSVLNAVAPALRDGLKSDNPYLRHYTMLAIDDLGPQAVEFLDDIRAMLKIDDGYAARVGEFILSTRETK